MAILRSRRRRALAAPFVITAALAPACVPVQQPAPAATTDPGAAPAQSPAEGSEGPPRVIANPPPPGANPPAAPPGAGTWTQQGDRWFFNYDDGSGTVLRDKDGVCRFSPRVECPAGAICNPPPPRRVACPDGLPQ